jgi:uncharacterized protein with PIN domain
MELQKGWGGTKMRPDMVRKIEELKSLLSEVRKTSEQLHLQVEKIDSILQELDTKQKRCIYCGKIFLKSGRRKFCSDACKQAHYRQKKKGGV